MKRVELARELLGYESVRVANIFALPSYRTGGISELGATEQGWSEARTDLMSALIAADTVLLAYGKVEPTGSARLHHRA